MPLTEVQAKSVLTTCREFFDGGFKSSNKVRVEEGTEIKTARSVARALQSSQETLGALSGSAIRELINIHQAERPEFRQKDRLTVGSLIAKMNKNSGNCAEQSCYALYIASRDHQAKGYCCSLAQSDHVFAVFPGGGVTLRRLKTWLSLNITPSGDDSTWIVDSWANIACRITDYPQALRARLELWNKAGKRINWKPHGSSQEMAWTAPMTEAYTTEIFASGFSWSE